MIISFTDSAGSFSSARNAIGAEKVCRQSDWRLRYGIGKEGGETGMSAKDILGLWCDDITFCQENCDWMDCPRNKQNIRDRTIPHSYSVDIPNDCPKKETSTVESGIDFVRVVMCKDCKKHYNELKCP